MVNAAFRFEPVGQGGFYTGIMRRGEDGPPIFSMVYDCGSKSGDGYLEDAISGFKDRLGKELDVLLLSHIHEDHVSGVTELLAGIKCKRVIMPYMSPYERLIVAAAHGRRDVADYDDYLNFLKSPHNYLLERSSVERIIYIAGNTERSRMEDGLSLKPPTGEEQSDELLTDNLENADVPPELENNKDGRVQVKKGNGAFYMGRIWEFYLYHEQADITTLAPLVNQLLKEIYSITTGGLLNQPELEQILNDKPKLKALRDKLKKILPDVNKAGLVMLHKPLDYGMNGINGIECSIHTLRRLWFDHLWFGEKRNGGRRGITLLTGDICLSQVRDSVYIDSHLRDVLVFQVPHHGSRTGWETDYLGFFGNWGTYAVIPFGYGNTYGHPRPEVLLGLEEERMPIYFCTQLEYFEYRISLNADPH